MTSDLLKGATEGLKYDRSFIHAMMRWDTSWYKRIIQNGYDIIPSGHDGGDAANWAFFPLYPTLIRIVTMLFGFSIEFAGVLTSSILFLFSQMYVYKYVRMTRGEAFATTAVILFILGPYTFYFTTLYTEALFVLLLVMSFYYMEKENWVACAVSAAFLSATRGTGVLFFIPLFLKILIPEFQKTKNVFLIVRNIWMDHKKLLVLLCSPLGLFAYMTYLYIHVGDPFAFYHVEVAWGRVNSHPLAVLIKTVQERDIPRLYLGVWGIGGVILSVYLMVKKRWEEGVYGFICMIIPMMSSMLALPRYFIGTTVTVFALVDLLHRIPEKMRNPIIIIFCGLNPIFLILWFVGHYIVV